MASGKRAEDEASGALEAMLRAIADPTADPKHVKDREGRALLANPATLRALGQLLAAQRLEAIGRLAGGVAHAINNLLTPVLSGAEGLLQCLDRGKPVRREDAEAILEAGGRSRDLARQLLAVARRQVLAPGPVDLNDLVRKAEEPLRRLLPESIHLAVSLDPDLWPALGDEAQIQQVLLSLAASARDAMPDGGRLVIETANARGGEGAKAPRDLPGPGVRLTVRDSGASIPPEARDRLFEPFFTAEGRGRQAGLGLAAAHGIVAQSNGFIAVESEPGRGAAFHVHLPRAARGGT